jgi:hypothetical protein
MMRRRSLARLRARREQLQAELIDCKERHAWFKASDDPFELQEANAWAAQVAALEHALSALEIEIFKAELDEL